MIIASALLAIPLAVLKVSPAPLLKYLVDDLLISRDSAKLYQLPAIVIAIFSANFIIRFLHYYLLRIVIARVNQKLRNNLYSHVMGLSADYYTSQSTGTLMSRVAVDPQQVDAGVSCINILVREPLTFIALLGYAFSINWKLTLIMAAIFPLLAWVFTATGRNLKRYITRMAEENARLFSTLQETFTGIRVIQSFRLEAHLREKFHDRIGRFTRYLLKTAALEEAAHPMVELLTAFAIAAVAFYGGREVLAGNMTSGDLLGFFAAFGLMMDPIRRLNEVSMKLHQAAGACDRIFEVFEWKPRLVEVAKPERLERFEREIRVEALHFSYPDAPEREVLCGIDFSLKKGSALALVGESGAGKTSLAQLLPRIFDPTSGKILIDDIDIRQAKLSDLRSLIAIVSQDVFLFNDTVEENIRCGRLGATKIDIHEAARRAHALEFIERLPLGMKTFIGDRGVKLSGGERQRLSIARAFLKHSPILVLDEATSSLDTASEKFVQQALDDLMQDRTTILIAHRLSTVKNADRIIVLKDGKIIESGSHSELIRHDGEYARFQRIGAS